MIDTLNNPFNFEFILFRYLYTVKDNIDENFFADISSHKLKRYVEYLNVLDKHLNVNQKMLFRDEMFSFNRFELSTLKFVKNKLEQTQIEIHGTLKDSIPPFYYPESGVTFLNVKIHSIINGHKERVSQASILRLPLILQGVEPSYDAKNNKHFVDIYVSVDIYNPKFDEMIKIDALSNICQIRISYEEVLIHIGLRNMSHNIFISEK